MSHGSRSFDGSLLIVSSILAFACGGGQAEAPPAEAATAPAPVAAAPPAPAATPAPPMTVPAPEASTAAPQTAPAAPATDKRPHHGRGMATLLAVSLGKVELRPDQKTEVDGAVSDLEKQGGEHADAGKQLVSDMADGIAAGKIDHAKTDADVKKLVEAVNSTKAGVQQAVNRLHKALDPAQRKKLAEEMKARSEEMRAKNDEKPDENLAHEARMKLLSEVLSLSPEQVEKLKEKMKGVTKAQLATKKTNMAAMQKHAKAIGDAFETDKFDAKKVGVGERASEMAKTMAKERIAFMEAILTVVTPEQRAKLAEHVRKLPEGD